MVQYITLLRGINVGGHVKIRMDDLVFLYGACGFTDVRTYLRSGNVLCESPISDPLEVAALLEEGISRKWGFTVRVIVRSREDLQTIIAENPFLRECADSGTLHVTFLAGIPKTPASIPLHGTESPDRYSVVGSCVFLSCPSGYGRTTFSTLFFERNLGVAATTRNWKTVATLVALAFA